MPLTRRVICNVVIADSEAAVNERAYCAYIDIPLGSDADDLRAIGRYLATMSNSQIEAMKESIRL